MGDGMTVVPPDAPTWHHAIVSRLLISPFAYRRPAVPRPRAHCSLINNKKCPDGHLKYSITFHLTEFPLFLRRGHCSQPRVNLAHCHWLNMFLSS